MYTAPQSPADPPRRPPAPQGRTERLASWLSDQQGGRPHWHGEVIKGTMALTLVLLVAGLIHAMDFVFGLMGWLS